MTTSRKLARLQTDNRSCWSLTSCRFRASALLYGCPMSILRQMVRFFQNLAKSNTPPPGKIPDSPEMEMEIELKRGIHGG